MNIHIHLRQMCQRAEQPLDLKGKIDQNVKTYYVYCSDKNLELENSIGPISRFMLVEMIIILIGIPFSFYMAQRTVKPIEKLGKIAKEMENNKPIDFERV